MDNINTGVSTSQLRARLCAICDEEGAIDKSHWSDSRLVRRARRQISSEYGDEHHQITTLFLSRVFTGLCEIDQSASAAVLRLDQLLIFAFPSFANIEKDPLPPEHEYAILSIVLNYSRSQTDCVNLYNALMKFSEEDLYVFIEFINAAHHDNLAPIIDAGVNFVEPLSFLKFKKLKISSSVKLAI